jgi:LuxR family maltose regulon positive regulatory protein
VLVSAPAGFGKTSLLTQWLAAVADHGHVVAWLALDERDKRPGSFWPHLVAAIGAAVPGFGAGLLALLESSWSATEGVLASLVNEIDALSGELYLALDDYHLIDDQGIQAGASYLLGHLPAQAHLLIATRADPPLPLARLRARGDLVGIRAADLLFTVVEASKYLNDVTGLDLRAEDIGALEARTGGWIAAFQLAALSVQGRDDIAGFIAGFTGNDRYIVDYLVEEVLARQPDGIRSFLLRTSVLDQLSGPLCDAVTCARHSHCARCAVDRRSSKHKSSSLACTTRTAAPGVKRQSRRLDRAGLTLLRNGYRASDQVAIPAPAHGWVRSDAVARTALGEDGPYRGRRQSAPLAEGRLRAERASILRLPGL